MDNKVLVFDQFKASPSDSMPSPSPVDEPKELEHKPSVDISKYKPSTPFSNRLKPRKHSA